MGEFCAPMILSCYDCKRSKRIGGILSICYRPSSDAWSKRANSTKLDAWGLTQMSKTHRGEFWTSEPFPNENRSVRRPTRSQLKL